MLRVEMVAATGDEKPMDILMCLLLWIGFSCGEISCSLSHHGVLAHRLDSCCVIRARQSRADGRSYSLLRWQH